MTTNLESLEPPEPVWLPDPAEAQRSILAAFARWVEREHAVDLPGYNAL